LRAVTPYKNAGKRRNLYLDLRQRRALLKAATGAVRVGTSLMMIEKHYGHLVASAARTRLAKVAML
jgi:hypothetical protein